MYNRRNTFLIFLLICSLFSCDTLKKSSNKDKNTKSKGESSWQFDNGDSDSDQSSKNASASDSDDATISATAIEMKMLDEINKLRKNPKGYIDYIQDYLDYFETQNFPSLGAEKRAAQELISQLRVMNSLPELTYHEDLYKVAEKHGKELKKRGDIFFKNPHKGDNGSSPDQRVKRRTDLKISGENFGSAHERPRYQVISLLVDAGVEGKGHRVNILDPRWNVGAFYNIGQIGQDPGCWLQLFGYEKKKSESTDSSSPSKDKLTLEEANRLVSKATYMKAPERAMLNEINLLRSNPRAYVKQIEDYKEKVRTGEVFPFVPVDEELEIADGLIRELKKMGPLSLLKPNLKLYNIALSHGEFLKQKGNPDLNPNPHAGRNGKGAHARIVEGTGMSAGGENYQGTFVPMRETLIGLLVDSGIPGFGHRKALLNPIWDHGVCRNFGPVRSAAGPIIPDNWLQNFAQE